jgi:hypothetical protein
MFKLHLTHRAPDKAQKLTCADSFNHPETATS